MVAGAAAVMVGVFLAFATTDVATVRQLGVGLAIAIAIDATVVRLILLPYALRMGGRFTWWLPSWLENHLPVIDTGVERRHQERPYDAADEPASDVSSAGSRSLSGALRDQLGAAAVPAVHTVPAAPMQ